MQRFFLTSLLLTAAILCPRAVGANSVASGPDDLTIMLEGACPGRVVFRYEEALPNRRAGIAFSPTQGNFLLPGPPCDGTLLGLSNQGFQLVWVFRTNAEGHGRLVGHAASRICGGYLQLIVEDGRPCQTSNVVQIPQ